MDQTKSRISWLDMARGYGMILVIYAHLHPGEILEKWIYTFHMPLFFFLSGYVYRDEGRFRPFLKRKMRSMVLPYFALGVPMLIYDIRRQYISGTYKAGDAITQVTRFLRQQRMWTLWFLACLFLLNLLFYWARKILKTNMRLAVLAIISTSAGLLFYRYGGKPLLWNADVCLMAYPFFFAGYWWRQKHEMFEKYLDRRQGRVISFLLFGCTNVLCGYLTHRISGNGMEMFDSTYGMPILTYISAFAGIACVIILSRKLVLRPIRYIGRNSMMFFAWHQTIMIPESKKLLTNLHLMIGKNSSMMEITAYKLAQLGIIICVLMVCNWMICNTRLKVILGRTI